MNEPKDIRISDPVVNHADGSVTDADGQPAGDRVFRKIELVDAEQFKVEIKFPTRKP